MFCLHTTFIFFDIITSQLSNSTTCYTVFIISDFNGHNILWGNKENKARGELIEKFITTNDTCLINDKSFTYLHYPTGSFSSIDLS